jgi:iron(III) transport system substrate-binding protein
MRDGVPLTRREFALAALGLVAGGCSSPSGSGEPLVLYTSADDPIARLVVDRFTRDTGVAVRVVGDTEATKSTGLIARLAAEKDRPKAHVFWSSEAMGAVKLRSLGLLAPVEIPGRAEHLRASDHTWHAFAYRARVIAFHTGRVASPPRRLRDLTAPGWRVGMARPQFGTTRSHMAQALLVGGRERFRAWLGQLRGAGLRLYDGNSGVVRGLAFGEIDVGLTDTDDVHAGRANGWPVGMAYEAPDQGGAGEGLPSAGALAIPNTVARIRGTAHPDADRLVRFLAGEACEEILARSDSRNWPTAPGLALTFPELAIPEMAPVSWESLAEVSDEAVAICDELGVR